MPDKKISPKDFQAILQLNLPDVVGLTDKSEEEQTKYLQKFNELVWTLFFQSDGKDLPEEELEKVGNLIKEKKFEELDSYFEKKFPDMKARISANTIVAKEIVIAQYLGKLIYILKNSKPKDKEELQKELNELAQVVKDKKWEEFSKSYKFLDKLRVRLND